MSAAALQGESSVRTLPWHCQLAVFVFGDTIGPVTRAEVVEAVKRSCPVLLYFANTHDSKSKAELLREAFSDSSPHWLDQAYACIRAEIALE